MTETPATLPLAELTAEIVGAYVAHNNVAFADLPTLITTVAQQLVSLGQKPAELEEEKPEAIVPIKRSISQDAITCLICGQKQKMLKRHLATPEDYRAMFGLKDDYPLVAPAYAATRSALAKEIGLGRKPEPKPAAKTVKAPRKSSVKKPAAQKKPARSG